MMITTTELYAATAEPHLTVTSEVRSSRYYGHFFTVLKFYGNDTTVEPHLTVTSEVRSPRYYGHFFTVPKFSLYNV